MKIGIYILDLDNLAGTERTTLLLANALAIKHEVILLSNVERSQIKMDLSDNVRLVNLPVFSVKKDYFKLFKGVNTAIDKFKLDVVISVETLSILFTLPIILWRRIRRKRIKLVVWEHFNFTVDLGLKMRNLARRFAARYADGIVVLTAKDREIWLKNLNVRSQIANISNANPFEANHSTYDVNSEVAIAVGRLTFQKGFDRLIEAWALIKADDVAKNWKLKIIGGGEDENQLKAQANQLGILDQIIFVPKTSNIQYYYQNAGLLIMTSRFEGLPMTLLEAQSYGLPIIAYDCLTGPAEIVNEKNGSLVKDGDIEALIKQVLILMKDKSLRESMSQNASINIKQFSSTAIVERWEKFLLTL